MNPKPANAICSYCQGEITGDKFLLADESAVVLRLHPQCAAKLGKKLESEAINQWSASYWQDKTHKFKESSDRHVP